MAWQPSARARAGQWVLLALLLAAAWLLVSNAATNLARRHLGFGFDFLAYPSNFDIPFRLVHWTEADSFGRALYVSALNTLLVSAMGIVAATLLGLLVGLMRLSSNWLLRMIGVWFVELVRNTPQLIQIIFWYVAVLQTLPGPRQSIPLPASALLNIRGLYLPVPVLVDAGWGRVAGWAALLVLVAMALLWAIRRVRARALVLLPVAIAVFCLGVDHLDRPALRGFNIQGGVQVPPELVALWLGLSIYGAAFIAEIVRAAILGVHKGQREAALSLGLKPAPVTFLVVLPQALRIMVPPLTSQYLNLIKSSSLGAAVAYPEIFQIFAGTVLNQSGREIETILIVMAFFLVINLATSALMNWYSQHVALVER